MKRKTYTIRLNDVKIGTRHAWNTSLAFIRTHVKHNMTGTTCRVNHHSAHKVQGVGHTEGWYIWVDDLGNEYVYQITLEK